MTGAYLIVKRDGKFESVEVEHLTDEERKELLKNDERIFQWFNSLAKADNLLKSLEQDGAVAKCKGY